MNISLRNKILLLFLGLLIISAVATIGSVLLATNNNVALQAKEKLAVGQRVFERLIIERGNQLFDSAAVLVADFGFKQAVTSSDTPTIQSALENNGNRIGADLMLLLTMDGKLLAASGDVREPLKQFHFRPLLLEAEQQGGLSTIVLLGDRIYQLVMLPVQAPITVAWAVIGMHIDQKFADQLGELTNLDVTFWGSSSAGTAAEVSTLSNAAMMQGGSAESAAGPSASIYSTIEGDSHSYLTLPVELAQAADYRVEALLSSSLSAAYARFSPLKLQMLVISSITLLLSVIGAYFISRNVTRPIGSLVEAARRISAGDYQQPVALQNASDEIGVLSNSFHLMQEGIAQREQQLSFLAYHDGLTAIANRIMLAQQLAGFLLSPETKQLAVLRLNINQFKQVNDTFGYEVGDTLLKSLAAVLVGYTGDNNLVARLSADEFALLLPDADEHKALSCAAELQQSIRRPQAIGDVNLTVSVTVGAALFPEHGDQSEQLLRRADIALDSAQDRQLSYACYQQGQDESHLRRIALVSELKIALEQDHLQIFFQPKVDLQLGRVTQVEALLRWIHRDYGFVSPEEFILLAEQSGLMPRLTNWVLKTVFLQAYRWQQLGIDVAIAINLSAYDLVEGFPARVETLLQTIGIESDRIILEITESAVMENPETAIQVLEQLRELGFKLSIDDYGTGYSSLAQLKNMPVDELKIDKSFVMKLEEDQSDQVIVKSTIELAHNIGLTVVAEGVETLGAYHLLEKWGCDKLQGYYISRPLPCPDFEEWLAGYESPTQVQPAPEENNA